MNMGKRRESSYFKYGFYMNETVNQVDNYSKEDNQSRKYSRYQGMPLLISVQLFVSILILIVMFTFKVIGGEYFTTLKKWYFENINNSVIAKENLKEYKQAFIKDIPFINDETKGKIIETSYINSTNNIEQVPIGLSTVISKPIEKGIITSRFGKRNDPITGQEKIHYGLDICAKEGTPIYSVMPGTVEKAENSPSFGNFLIIDHGNGIKTLYAHCKELKVNTGDEIIRGQNIALMGNTGYYSTGTHLHVEIIINDKKYDPEPFFENISV